jgi:hypothetical protein
MGLPLHSRPDPVAGAGGVGQLRVSSGPQDAAWDDFVARCPGGHHEQTSRWAQVKACYGWESMRVLRSRDGQIVAGAQVLVRPFSRWGRIGYVTRGPLVSDPALVPAVVHDLHAAARRARLTYLAVVPPYNGHAFVPAFEALGFWRKPDVIPPSGLMTATLLLDLTDELDSMLARMRRKTRQHLRRGQREGVVVREGVERDVETFRELMWALCLRRGTSPSPPQRDFFANVWKFLHPAGLVKLFVAELGGQPVSALLTFAFGDAVRAWKIGWAGDHGDQSPNEVVYWEAIRWAKRQGYRLFDFVWIEDDLARTLLRGDPVRWDVADGMSFFKVGFGGVPTLLPAPCCNFYNPMLRAVLKVGGRHVIGSTTFARLAGRLWGGLARGGEG